ncbi:GyrI-like domain-containing protein [Neobacillus ginsengisoli]|uniref:AraC family transcriptional regulator n=1 Tax=Neobacillus ginsengisoli TaxID=904295 RepID=A0ABT9XXY8_9BACI|nr:GyrI-like domain-containing protein [Neobacillus ginsengisoli]MDQ0200433.1 AraC family transcriptional regulator [Neobacillus ginsengisoli]
MKYKIVERDAFRVTGIKREFSCGSGEAGIPGVPEFWGEVQGSGITNQLVELNNGEIKGLLGITSNYNAAKNVVDYSIATEYSGQVPDGLASFEIPASKWVVFEVRGPVPGAIINAWHQIYTEWFPANQYEPAALPPFEAYIDSDLSSENSYNEIWVPIK